jgi:heparinase II/III-like protein
LLGEEGAARYDALSRAVPAASCRAFPHGGYYILRHAPEPVVIFDCGPLGYLSLAAHGHADCLSLCLSVKGEWLLVDPGTYVYHEEQEWRRWFRGTAAHNTLTIEGLDQSEQTGHTMWGRRANGSLRAFFCDEHLAWVEGDHDGYRHLKPPRTHHRAVALGQPGYLLVIDRVIGGPCDVSINWQFAPSLRVTRADRQLLVIERSCDPDVTHRYQAQLLFDADVTIHYGEDEPLGGWVSPTFNKRVAAPRVEARAAAVDGVPLVTAFWLADTPAPDVELRTHAAGTRLLVTAAAWRHELELRWQDTDKTANSLVRVAVS